MQGIRTTTITILALGLLAGSAAGALAQDDGAAATEAPAAVDSPAVTETPAVDASLPAISETPSGEYFTGTAYYRWPPDDPGEESWTADDVGSGRNQVIRNETISTSDPRFGGTLTRVLNADWYFENENDSFVIWSEAWRVENDDGAWTGEGTAISRFAESIPFDQRTDRETMVLAGEGAYEGLTAYVLVDVAHEPAMVEGAVFEYGLPAFPEPPAAE